MNWPSDADGDVFRRLQGQGFDFGKTYLVDLNVDFEDWPPPKEAVDALRARYPSAVVYAPEEDSPGYAQFQIYDRLTHDLVVRVQREVSELMAPFGGVCESWGVLH